MLQKNSGAVIWRMCWNEQSLQLHIRTLLPLLRCVCTCSMHARDLTYQESNYIQLKLSERFARSCWLRADETLIHFSPEMICLFLTKYLNWPHRLFSSSSKVATGQFFVLWAHSNGLYESSLEISLLSTCLSSKNAFFLFKKPFILFMKPFILFQKLKVADITLK